MPATAKKVSPPAETEAARAVAKLKKLGLSDEEIAVKTRVSLNSVLRWKRGVVPHRGHLLSLREVVAVEAKKRQK